MMTDCEAGDIRDLLPEYAHDRLAPAVRDQVAAHVAGCEPCQAELALIGAVRSSLAAQVPTLDTRAIAARVIAIPRRPARRSWVERRWQFAAAASALLMVGVSYAVLGRGGSGMPGVDSTPPRIEAPSGGNGASTGGSTLASNLPAASAQASARLELSFGGGLADLSDEQLTRLLSEIDSFKATPMLDPDEAALLSSLDTVARGGAR
ncbi:MAG: zf-HC2 domain-containing protein [Gemmatimonadaceae bacterium]|nr:zf-HC2 domain-containing protein [Gemmatimonadaceae bacterium]